MLPERPYRKLMLPCLATFLLLGGCSYQPLPDATVEPETVVRPPAEESSGARPAPSSGDKIGENSARARQKPRKPLSLPPAPQDETLDLEPAGPILIRLPRTP